MTDADDIVKARIATQRAGEAARAANEAKAEIDSGMRYLSEAIPQLLALLEARDYPDAELIYVRTSGSRRFFRRKESSVEKAAWLLDEDRWSEGHSAVHMLADGSLVSSGFSSQSPYDSGAIAIAEIPATYSEEGARQLLRRAAGGVKRLIAEYTDD